MLTRYDYRRMIPPDDVPLGMFVDFYATLAITYREPGFRHAEQKLFNDAQAHLRRIADILAPACFDYLFAASLGEARHAKGMADAYLCDIPSSDSTSRGGVYYNARHYDPKRTLPKLVEVFESHWTRGSYGGEKWAMIARGAQNYFTLDKVAFIDHAADLQHNSGCAFDKGHIILPMRFSTSRMRNFLDYKASVRDLPGALSYTYGSAYEMYYPYLSLTGARLVHRYAKLYLNKEEDYYPTPNQFTVFPKRYTPIEYGDAVPTVSWSKRSGSRSSSTPHFWESTDDDPEKQPAHIHCEICSSRILRDDDGDYNSYEADGYTICHGCYIYNTSTCDHCDRLHLQKNLSHIEDSTLCHTCYHRKATTCAQCAQDVLKRHATPALDLDGYKCPTPIRLCPTCQGKTHTCPTCHAKTYPHPAPWLTEVDVWHTPCAVCGNPYPRRIAIPVEQPMLIDWH